MTMDSSLHLSVSELAELEHFKSDTRTGLSLPDKVLSYQYCFDALGISTFNQIILSTNVYPFACEAGILNNYEDQLALYLENEAFNLIELSPGGGINSPMLIENFLQNSLNFYYHAIDISKVYLDFIEHRIKSVVPDLKIHTIHAECLTGLKGIHSLSKQRNMILFLGSQIGHMGNLHLNAFLKNLRRSLNTGDYLLIGFDLRKQIDLLVSQYNTNQLYQNLYLNLLQRINRELNGNFDIKQFKYVANHNTDKECINHFLVSNIEQDVAIQSLGITFNFSAAEPIYLGSDYKYRQQQILTIAEDNGFEVVKIMMDDENNFVECLWKVEK